MPSIPYLSLGTRIARESRDLYKYIKPGAGKRLLEWEEARWGINGRLPEHYLAYHLEWKKGPQEWIHARRKEAKFEKDEFGQVVEVVNANTPAFYPDKFHNGLWGGEGVVWGISEPKSSKHYPNYNVGKETYWWPALHETVVYSEILDKHIAMTATKRGEWLVDKHQGFDLYLLETPVNEVYATDLLKIKRCMLLSLVRETLYPNDTVKRKEVLSKYEKFVMPEEIADWHGLPLHEAHDKQFMLEKLYKEWANRPKKQEYRQELVGMLKQGYLQDIDPAILYEDDKESKTVSQTLESVSSTIKGIKDKFKK